MFGEIDCREGLLLAVDKLKYPDLDAAMHVLADIYLQARTAPRSLLQPLAGSRSGQAEVPGPGRRHARAGRHLPAGTCTALRCSQLLRGLGPRAAESGGVCTWMRRRPPACWRNGHVSVARPSTRGPA